MVLDAYTITDTDPKWPDTNISIWYQCIPNELCHLSVTNLLWHYSTKW